MNLSCPYVALVAKPRFDGVRLLGVGYGVLPYSLA